MPLPSHEVLLRRIYTSKKGRKIRDEAIERLREVRSRIDPDILRRVKDLIDEQGGIDKIFRPEKHEEGPDMIPIDREKNAAIVKKYMELKENHENETSH